MNIPDHEQLVDAIEAFRTRHDIAETRFGREAIANPNFIRGLREGVSPTLETLTKVRDYMARVDAEATLRAKLDAPVAVLAGREEQEIELPFAKAPVNATGASSPTSSTTTAPRPTPPANGSCPDCSKPAAERADRPNRSCSAEDAFVRDPSKPTEAAR